MAATGERATAVSRALRLTRFARVLLTMSLAVQLPATVLLGAALWDRGVPLAPLAALLAVAFLNVPLAVHLLEGFTDRRMSPWRLHLVELPYFTAWAACFAFVFTGPVAWLGALFAGVRALPVLEWTFLGTVCLAVWAVYAKPRLFRTRHVEVAVPSLPAPLDGYTIVQLSDLHVGTHAPPERASRWVERANELRPDLVALTGDLVSSGTDYLDAAIGVLGTLRARDGVVFSPGNHDYFCDAERLFSLLETKGIEVLRNRGRLVSRDGAALWVAGADDYWKRLADLPRALDGRPGGALAIVLAHDPRLWTTARALGVTLTLAGHTHGGQVGLPFLSRWVNLARTTFPHSSGAYRDGSSWLVVSNGLGTTGPPARLGVTAEVVVVTLRKC